jgi:ubiquinone/menaquinone biosynthesis C-methylase UbiE
MGGRGHWLTAAGYDRMMLPLERRVLAERRPRLLAGLSGEVLEIGAGTGVNLPHYRAASRVVAAEPDPAMRARLARRVADAPVPVEVADVSAESLPFPDASFDAVVATLVLCTVADPARALAEARRVLRPAGRLVVLEHVRGQGRLAWWQDRLTPLFVRVAAGCHPNRDTRAAIERAGFAMERVEEFQPLPGWLPISPMLQAVAVAVAPQVSTAGPGGRSGAQQVGP